MEQYRDVLLSPLCIVGAPRSGTTWLQKLLLESEGIHGGQESHFYSVFHAAYVSASNSSDSRAIGLSAYWTLDEFDAQMRDVWINTFFSLVNGKENVQLLLEKTPIHALFIDQIARFLPNSKFLHLIRDSRSVTASLLAASKGWGNHWAPNSTRAAALEWYRHVRYARMSETAKNPDRYLEVYYEDLLKKPLETLIKIYEFVGLPFSTAELERAIENQSFSKQKSQGSRLPGVHAVQKKEPEGFLRKGEADAWRKDLNWHQQAIVWFYTRKLMAELGYGWKGKIE